jgi:hypothetical protein
LGHREYDRNTFCGGDERGTIRFSRAGKVKWGLVVP